MNTREWEIAPIERKEFNVFEAIAIYHTSHLYKVSFLYYLLLQNVKIVKRLFEFKISPKNTFTAT